MLIFTTLYEIIELYLYSKIKVFNNIEVINKNYLLFKKLKNNVLEFKDLDDIVKSIIIHEKIKFIVK